MIIRIESYIKVVDMEKQNPKEFHVWDFPDSIYVKFNEEYRKQLYQKLISFYGSTRKIAKGLCGDLSVVTAIRRGYYYDGLEAYVNVKFVKIIIRTITETKKDIEKNIIAYKCKSGNLICNPILPVKENPEVYNIISHLICDGSAGKGKSPYYGNTCKDLRDEVKKNLQIFGTVEVNEYLMHTNVYGVMFPKAISDILAHCFNVKFVYPEKFPEAIFESSEECKKTLIRALFDDEGCASAGVLVAISSSKNMLVQAKEILRQLGIEETSITKGCNYYSLKVLAAGQERFAKEIGLTHPEKQKRLLSFNLKRKVRADSSVKVREDILDFLKEPKTLKEIANMLGKKKGTTRIYLIEMREKGKVKHEMISPTQYWKWSRSNF